jgi:hypothetical protein
MMLQLISIRRLVFTLLLLAIWPLGSCFAQELELKTVLDNTGVTPPSKVGFREQRHNPMLKEPLLLSGYLQYQAAGQLSKVIETPFSESFSVKDDKIEIQQDGKTKRLSLSRSKPLKAMLGGIEAVLAGDTAELAETFDYELTGSEDDWTLVLVPKSKKITAHLSSMTVKGDANVTHSIRIEQNDDEWSLMEILNDVSQL